VICFGWKFALGSGICSGEWNLLWGDLLWVGNLLWGVEVALGSGSCSGVICSGLEICSGEWNLLWGDLLWGVN